MRWPIRRRQAAVPADEQITRPTDAWRTLPPLTGVLGAAPNTPVTEFVRGLPSRWQQPPILDRLGHESRLDAPTGLVAGLATTLDPLGGPLPELRWSTTPLADPISSPVRTELPNPPTYPATSPPASTPVANAPRSPITADFPVTAPIPPSSPVSTSSLQPISRTPTPSMTPAPPVPVSPSAESDPAIEVGTDEDIVDDDAADAVASPTGPEPEPSVAAVETSHSSTPDAPTSRPPAPLPVTPRRRRRQSRLGPPVSAADVPERPEPAPIPVPIEP
ncbi:MAG TPA: hypothetical protein VGM75_09035, partial [Pseudonocardiaceae bacterium]